MHVRFTENQKDEFEINTDNGHVKKEIYAKNVSNQPSAKVEDEENITKIADEPSLQKSIQFQRKHVKLRDIKEVELKNNIQSDELYVENLNMNKTQIVLDEFSETQNLTDISDLEQNQFTEMLAEKILYSIEDNQTTATIKLEPEFLGKLDLEIVIDRGIMVAEFTVENQQVKALIEQNLTELRHNLEKNGVFVEGFNVSVNHHDKGDPHQGFNKRRFRNMIVDSGKEEGPGGLGRIIDMYNYWEENYLDYTI
ncbi:MAG TPA: flagellar hook-length control protein FliK [Thermoanaerobacterales bacterium]|nr:flagellar hook-length control protein FliK [Thermoanaerobacterales bacterium]